MHAFSFVPASLKRASLNLLRLKKNALNKECALEDRVLQSETRAHFLERIVRAFLGFTVHVSSDVSAL